MGQILVIEGGWKACTTCTSRLSNPCFLLLVFSCTLERYLEEDKFSLVNIQSVGEPDTVNVNDVQVVVTPQGRFTLWLDSSVSDLEITCMVLADLVRYCTSCHLSSISS